MDKKDMYYIKSIMDTLANSLSPDVLNRKVLLSCGDFYVGDLLQAVCATIVKEN